MINTEYLISLDASLRSTGWCVFNQYTNELEDFGIIKTKDVIDEIYQEDLLLYIKEELEKIYCKYSDYGSYDSLDIVIEGLSLGSKSTMKDLIDGMHWGIRTHFRQYLPNNLIGVIAPTEWRNNQSTKENRKVAKELFDKDPLKQMMVAKLPGSICNDFMKYIQECDYNKESLYDLTDAYFLGIYRLLLNK